jgi:hypothetical protein
MADQLMYNGQFVVDVKYSDAFSVLQNVEMNMGSIAVWGAAENRVVNLYENVSQSASVSTLIVLVETTTQESLVGGSDEVSQTASASVSVDVATIWSGVLDGGSESVSQSTIISVGITVDSV